MNDHCYIYSISTDIFYYKWRKKRFHSWSLCSSSSLYRVSTKSEFLKRITFLVFSLLYLSFYQRLDHFCFAFLLNPDEPCRTVTWLQLEEQTEFAVEDHLLRLSWNLKDSIIISREGIDIKPLEELRFECGSSRCDDEVFSVALSVPSQVGTLRFVGALPDDSRPFELSLVNTVEELNRCFEKVIFRSKLSEIERKQYSSILFNMTMIVQGSHLEGGMIFPLTSSSAFLIPIRVESLKMVLHELVSFIIKAHERKESLEFLVSSLRCYYPLVQILIADDGSFPAWEAKSHKDSNIHHYRLAYDLGLSASRNYLVDRVSTKYFITLDDDFVFTNRTTIEFFVQVMENSNQAWIEESNRLDIVAGSLYTDENPYYDYAGLIEVDSDRNFRLISGMHGHWEDIDYLAAQCKLVDIVANFFVAKTTRVQRLQWDPELKLGEHQDFFLRAKQENPPFRVASCGNVAVYHKQDHSNGDYRRKRQREVQFLRRFLQKHKLKSFVLFSGVTYVRL